MNLIDFGDAIVETKQLAQGTRPDSIFQFGIKPGSPEDSLDVARLMLVTKPQPEIGAGGCAPASE